MFYGTKGEKMKFEDLEFKEVAFYQKKKNWSFSAIFKALALVQKNGLVPQHQFSLLGNSAK